MAVTRRTSRSRFTLILLILTSITLLTLDYKGFKPLDSARSAVLSVFSPVGDTASNVFRPVGDAWNGAFEGGDLKRENDDLKRQVDELQGQLAQNSAAQGDLEKLQAQLDLPFVGQIPTVRARVVSGAISNFDTTIELDKGASSGIDKGMPVVSGAGLIGSVVRVSDGRAVVKLITDRTSTVGVRVAGAPGLGVVQGQGDETRLRATQFDITTTLGEGNILVTSGAARSLFPPGIPVGTVLSTTTNDTALQKEADVKLLANLNDLTYVTVLLYKPPPE